MDDARATRLALGFWPARAFSAALELGVFTALADGPLEAPELAARLGLRSPALVDLLDALVGLGVLSRSADGYGSTGPVDPALTEVAGTAAYHAWADLPGLLREGSSRSMFQALLGDPDALERFVEAMASVSAPLHAPLVERLEGTGTICDLGGADGRLAVAIARRHPRARVITFDLPALVPLAERVVAAAALGDRVSVKGGDFLRDALPAADVFVLSLVLLDWPAGEKVHLLAAAARALSPGGTVVVLDRMTVAGGASRSTFEALRSLHLAVTTGEAHPYRPEDLARWLRAAGFGAPELTDIGDGFLLALAGRAG